MTRRGGVPAGRAPTLDAWVALPRPRRSCCVPFASAKRTACFISTRSNAGGSARSRRVSAGRSRASAPGSSRSRTWSSSSTWVAASSTPSRARRCSPPTTVSAPTRIGCGPGLIGLEAMLRLFTEQEANERAFTALHTLPRRAGRDPRGRAGPAVARPARALVPVEAPVALRLPPAPRELRRVWSDAGSGGDAPAASGAVCRDCSGGAIPLSADGLQGIAALLRSPLADARAVGLTSSRCTRRARGRHRVVRVPRRVPPARAVCLMRGRTERPHRCHVFAAPRSRRSERP